MVDEGRAHRATTAGAERGDRGAPVQPDELDDDRTPREALIYLPGLDLGLSSNRTATGVVERIQIACDRHTRKGVEWSVRWKTIRRGGRDQPTGPLATIVRKESDGQTPVVDIFEYQWAQHVVTPWEAQSTWKRALRAALALATGIPSLLRFSKTAGRKNAYGRAQLALAAAGVLCMVVYSIVLLGAVVISAEQLYSVARDSIAGEDGSATPAAVTAGSSTTTRLTNAPPNQPSSDPGERQTVSPVQVVAVLLTAAFGAIGKQREKASQIGSVLTAAQSYLKVGQGQPTASGGLTSLIDTLGDAGHYTNVRILAYSFGSVIALDSLFPTTDDPPEVMKAVTSLVTIGSPFDFVRAVRPHWTADRHALPEVPSGWLNVYSTIDLLGSNFRATAASDPDADADINAVEISEARSDVVLKPTQNHAWNLGIELTKTNIFEFYGFTSHGLYWGTDNEDDRNVFDFVVPTIYEGTAVFPASD